MARPQQWPPQTTLLIVLAAGPPGSDLTGSPNTITAASFGPFGSTHSHSVGIFSCPSEDSNVAPPGFTDPSSCPIDRHCPTGSSSGDGSPAPCGTCGASLPARLGAPAPKA